MIRNLVLIFNMAAFLIYRILFQDGGVEIKQNIPQSAKAGSDYTVELVITKGAVSGFAKLQQELPAGMTATAIETNSGTFSFVDQTVKIIWMSLPNDKEFKVTYKVSVSKDVSGPNSIGGKFSYIDNNEKKTVNIVAGTIDIENPDKPATAASTQPATTTDQNTTATTTPSSEGSTSNTITATGTSGLTCSRNIPVITNPEEFTVEININRGNVSGFAKLEETLPPGFTATSVESNNAVFSFVDQKAKFLWMALPNDNSFKVSYKVKKDAAAPSVLMIEGLFSYLENDVTQKVVIPAQNVNLQGGAPVAQNSGQENQRVAETTPQNNTTQTQETSTQTQTQTQSQPEPTNSTSAQTETTTQNNVAENTPEPTVAKTPEPAATASNSGAGSGAGVKYRVQILAAHKTVGQSYFENNHKIGESVNSEMHEGWHKYTIGSFNDYKQARDKRETVTQNNLPGPFVTAYNGGKRITVQEALMISNQKWVK